MGSKNQTESISHRNKKAGREKRIEKRQSRKSKEKGSEGSRRRGTGVTKHRRVGNNTTK